MFSALFFPSHGVREKDVEIRHVVRKKKVSGEFISRWIALSVARDFAAVRYGTQNGESLEMMAGGESQ